MARGTPPIAIRSGLFGPSAADESDEQFAAKAEVQKLAAAFDRHWLASAVPVLPPIGAGNDSKSDLAVLVQSDYEAVVQPAEQLGRQFIRNSFWMLVVMVSVSLALWYIVVRTFREPRAGHDLPPTGPSALTPPHSMTTIAARDRD